MVRTLLIFAACASYWHWIGRNLDIGGGLGVLDISLLVAKKQELLALLGRASTGEAAFVVTSLALSMACCALALSLPLLMAYAGVIGRGFWSLVGGLLGGVLFAAAWSLLLGPSPTPVLIAAGLLCVLWLRILASASADSFDVRKAGLDIDIQGDLVSVTSGNHSEVFPRGLVAMSHSAEKRYWEEMAGGSYTTTQVVTVINSDGSSGTAYVPKEISSPYYTVARSSKTGRTTFTLQELAETHDLAVARKPAGVCVGGLTSGGAAISFALKGLARLRFDWWCRMHPSIFFRPDGNAEDRIRRATQDALAVVRKERGKPPRYELLLDQDLTLQTLAAFYKNGVYLCSPHCPSGNRFVPSAAIAAYRDSKGLVFESVTFALRPELGAIVDRWAKVATRTAR